MYLPRICGVSSTNAFTTGSVTTAEAGEYLLAGLLAQGAVSGATFPFTLEVSGAAFNNNATADRVSAGAGSYSCSGTTGGAIENLATVVAAFSPKAGVVGVPSPGIRRVIGTAVQRASRW